MAPAFEFVQLGRTFGKDFQTSQLKLDSARLRLSRWGKSLSLDDDVRDTVSLQGRFRSEANVKHAEALLGQIVELFAEAEGVSNRYRGRTEPQDSSLAVYDPQTNLDPAIAKLHEKMRQLAIERQNRSGFRRLIEDITELVNDLDNLFPATQQSQRKLCDIEVCAIGEGGPQLWENGYNDSKISLEWLKRVFDVETRARANGKPRVLICDGFGTHETLEILEFCFKNNIILCRLPSYTSHKLQPCDVSVFAPLKTAYRDQVERLNRGGIHTIAKEHFTYLYAPARGKALTKRNIVAGWAAAGLFPFSPERVLRNTPKLPADLVVSVANEVGSSSQSNVPLTPATPLTPVTAEGLTVLHDLIKRDAGAPDEASKQRLERRVQKLVSAAKISVAKQSLLQDHNRLLCHINNEATVRRTTRSLVLSGGKGEGKVMRWEDLQRVRAERAAKELAAKEKGKGKRGRKRKTPAQEVEEETIPLEIEAGSSRPREKVSKKRRVQEPGPWRAPVATMY
ncbi:hypothetical protein GT037_010843 [Alternaria burnsii]|uniref:DDE-1 domain-containing protein n=1 Tax=Alternaria burnsii TaxID=1187904 RepID=A0A8H7ATK2_9PLEO|nr:uncharacterized protein GT037_010843 [Alternaria burnsii]KAF7671062.1 hypothetical protein GT037_010843 [Alternaria burnsii]